METSLIGKALDFGPRYYRFESCVSNSILTNSCMSFLNKFLICIFRRSLYLDVKLTSSSRQLASILLMLNLLRRVCQVNSLKWRCFLSYRKSRCYGRSIRCYTSLTSKKTFSLKALRLLNQNLPFSHYIIATDKGLMTHKTAIKHGIGGILVCVVL